MIVQNRFNHLSFALKTVLFIAGTIAVQQAQTVQKQPEAKATQGTQSHTSSGKRAGAGGSKQQTLRLLAGTGAVYYIDFSSGSDANNGTSKSTPWKHSPGMQGCSGSCAATSLSAGDSVIFKGGVTWDHTCFALNMGWSGASGNPIYFGVDQTWFAGSAWKRPIFSGDSTRLASGDGLIQITNKNYITIDNIELTAHNAYSNFGPANIELSCNTNVILTNLYVHNWSLDASVSGDDAHGGIVANNPSCNPSGTVIDHSVISNAEHTGNKQNGVAVRSTDLQFSVIHDVSTGQLFGRLHDSLLYNVSYPSGNQSFDSNYHTNVTYLAEWDGNGVSPRDPAYIYNNVIHDIGAGSGGLYPNICTTTPFYIWNNVVYNNYSGNSDIQIEPYGGSSGCGAWYLWNNTLEMPTNDQASVIRIVPRGFPVGTVVLQNTHFITDGGTFDRGSGVNNLTSDHNVTQTNGQANSQGYTGSESFAYSPISSSGATVGAAVNMTSQCTGPLTSLCSDTGYAVGLNTSTNSVISNPRATAARPANGAWDAGAYEFLGGTLDPPTNLVADPQ